MQELLKGHTAKTIGNHDFIELSVDEYTQLPPIPTNRDSIRRVPKMKNIFNEAYASNQIGTLTEVALGIVSTDFADLESGLSYKKGEWFVVDGNTRLHYWKMFPEKAKLITKGLTAKIHYLRNMDDVRFAYYPYNNAKSTEKASEILQGLARRYNWTPRQKVFQNGGYKSAIDWASYEPGANKADVFKAFNMCFEGLKILDGIPKEGSHTITNPAMNNLKSQSIIAACLIALRVGNNYTNLRMHDFIHKISTITYEDLDRAILGGELDPVEIIAAEYGEQSHRRSKNRDAEPWLKGLARSTKFESQAPQMDFLLYWIQKYLENPKVTWNFNKGIQPSVWTGAWLDYFPEETDSDE